MPRLSPRRSSLVASLAVLLALPLANCQCADDLAVVPGALAGRACDPESGAGLPGAKVALESGQTTVTDADGEYAFARLAPGATDITVTLQGVTRTFSARIASQKNTIVTDTACREQVPAPTDGALEGFVCNRHTGAMISDGEVLLPMADGELMITSTDDEGHFFLTGIPAGSYVVSIRGTGFQRSETVVVDEGRTTLLDIDSATCGHDVPEEPTPPPQETPGDPQHPGGPGGDDGEDPGNGDDPLICVSVTHTAEQSTDGRIFLVVDRSGSMDEDADGFNNSKWDALDNALGAVARNLSDSVELGLMLYPTPGADDSCTAGEVEVNLGAGHGDDVDDALGDTGPGGRTPTAEALKRSKDMLAPLADDGRPLAVLLATDGGPNCNTSLDRDSCECTDGDFDGGTCSSTGCLDDDRSVQRVAELYALGIRTYVLGLPGVESYTSVLDDMAQAGGTALPGVRRFYQPTDPAALEAALDAITQRELACRIDVDVSNAQTIEVRVGASTIALDPLHQNGWDVASSSTIELFGAACDQASVAGAVVSIDVCG